MTTQPHFRGLYTALITPFDADDQVNEEMLRQLLRLQIAAEVDGIVVLGTTGEAPTLTHSEQRRIIAIAREEITSKIPLLVGTGSYSTEQTIENTAEAKHLGADGALIITPYYNRPTQEGLYCHYKAIVEAVDLPLIVYNHSMRTGQNLQADTLARIATLPNIYGVKEISVSPTATSDMIEHVRRKRSNFTVLTGDDAQTLSTILLGGDGVIAVASNLIPVSMRNLVHAALAGDLEKAQDLHYALMPLFRALCIETNPIPIKAAMQLSGLDVGNNRLPLCPMLPHNLATLRHILAATPNVEVLHRDEFAIRTHR